MHNSGNYYTATKIKPPKKIKSDKAVKMQVASYNKDGNYV